MMRDIITVEGYDVGWGKKLKKRAKRTVSRVKQPVRQIQKTVKRVQQQVRQVKQQISESKKKFQAMKATTKTLLKNKDFQNLCVMAAATAAGFPQAGQAFVNIRTALDDPTGAAMDMMVDEGIITQEDADNARGMKELIENPTEEKLLELTGAGKIKSQYRDLAKNLIQQTTGTLIDNWDAIKSKADSVVFDLALYADKLSLRV